MCLPSRLGLGAKVMKNWLPLVLGPLLAMLSTPLLSCFKSGCTSSAKAEPHALFPPLPVAVGSPPCARGRQHRHRHNNQHDYSAANKRHAPRTCIMKPLISLWNFVPL